MLSFQKKKKLTDPISVLNIFAKESAGVYIIEDEEREELKKTEVNSEMTSTFWLEYFLSSFGDSYKTESYTRVYTMRRAAATQTSYFVKQVSS